MTPALAVVIPTYRRPEPLARTLAALARESESSQIEVVVCDDGSPAEEAAAIDAAVARQPSLSVRVIRQENAGPAAARNTGARASDAPLILFLDDDCAPAPGWIAAHRRERSPGERIAVMGHVAWSPHVEVTPFMEHVLRGAQFNYGAIADPARVPFTCFYTANCSLWRDDLERAGWFDATLPPYMEDTEFAYRLVGSGTRIVYREDAVVHHEHAVELGPYLDRQRRAGRAAVEVVARHPELLDVIGVSDVADLSLREQFYNALLRFAFVCGVEEGLAGHIDDRHLTGAELRSTFESWIAGWAVHQASALRSWRERADALTAEVARRDAALADVVQRKDDHIAELEGQLRRFNGLLPVRLFQMIVSRVR